MTGEIRAILAALGLLTGGAVGLDGDSSHLRTAPEAETAPDALPWPHRDPASMRTEDGRVRSRLLDLQEALGGSPDAASVVRTRYFLVGGDLLLEERTRLGTMLDGQVRRLVERFGGRIEDEPFPARVGVLLLGSRDRFALVEAQRFDCYPGEELAARLHVDGPRFVITADTTAPRGLFDHQLSRAVAKAWLHAMHAPRPLPEWLEQGFMTAAAWMETAPGGGFGRREAIESVRAGEPLESVFDDTAWTGTPGVEARAGLLVERLLEQPEALHAALHAIKSGRPWRESFEETYGAPPEDLADYATRWYRVND